METHAEDLRFVRQLAAGDETAFDGFRDRFLVALYRFALGRLGGDRELAGEVVQTVVAKALLKLEGYRGEAALLTWLCAICRNEILMWRRGARRAPQQTGLDGVPLAPAAGSFVRPPGSPEERLLRDERRERVHLVLDALPRRYARALEWKYLEDLPVREIAVRLGVGVKAAESVLSRARRAFRESHAGLDLADTAPATSRTKEVGSHG